MKPIEIIFEGVNKVSGVIDDVKSGLESIGKTSAESSDALSGIFTMEGARAMEKFKLAALDAFDTAKVAVGEFVAAAAEAELVGVRMEATIKALGGKSPTTARQINDLADELSKLTGFDDEALVEAQATLARMGSVSEDNFERATRVATDLAAATGMDLRSAFQSVGMAMENADFGRLARQIGDLPPEMQEAAKAALEMGNTLEVQEIILAGIEQKVAGAGEAIGETFTGQMNKLRTEYGNFQESIGTPLISLFEGLPEPIKSAGFAIYSLGGTFGPVISSMADLAIATRGLNAALGGQGLIGLLGQIRTLGATSFGPMLVQLGLVAIAIAAVAAVWMQWNEQIVKTNQEGAAAVAGAKSKLLADLQASGKSPEEIAKEYRAAQQRIRDELDKTNPALRLLIFNQDELIGSDEALRQTLVEMTGSQEEANRIMAESGRVTAEAANSASQASQSFGSVIDKLQSGQTQITGYTVMIGGIGLAWVAVSTAVKSAIATINQDVSTWLATASQTIATTWQSIRNSVSSAWQSIANTIRQWLDRIVNYVRSFGTNIKAAFQRVVNDAKMIGTNFVNGIWQGILTGWAALKSKIETLAKSLPQWIKDALGIASESKVMHKEVGIEIAKGIGSGFVEGMKQIKPLFDLAPASIGLTPAPVYSYARAGAPAMAGGNGGATVTGNTFAFYSPLTHDERRIIRKEQEDAAQREVLRSLR